MPNQPAALRMINVLIVDDDSGDVRLTIEALRETKLHLKLNVTPDGIEALAYLRRRGKYANAEPPDLVLLDLNMPRKDGRQMLAELKSDPELRHIPVVILTTSSAEQDVVKSYDLGANAYVTKPVDLDQFLTVVRTIEDFWFTVVKLPAG